jgi:putative efflux protein, MATE family
MSQQTNASGIRVQSFFALLKQAVLGSEHQDFTSGSIRRAVFLLAVPMVLEMVMESVFALVDIYVVGKLGVTEAVTTIALTEFVLTIVYAIGIGLSMAATAMVARRTGEKDHDAAARSGMQAIFLGIMISLVITIIGLVFPADILRLMGATPETIRIGTPYTRIVFASNMVIMLLFLINGIFRGSGDAAMAMRSLWLANICNIILCPILVLYGLGPIPAMGITGAALATSLGRGIGVLYQLYHLFGNKRIIKIRRVHMKPDWKLVRDIFNLAWTATLQFLIASASWMVLGRIMAAFGAAAVAGYGLSIRLIMFFLLPAWGLSNAAATLVGQNLGAKQPDRAERSVWTTAKYNTIFMIMVTLIFLLMATPIVQFMNEDAEVVRYAVQALQIMSLGYIFYGVGMVVTNAFNGAGDTKTPTLINLFGFWLFQIPLAGVLALLMDMGPKGVFIAVLVSETAITIAGIILFRRGTWKAVQI